MWPTTEEFDIKTGVKQGCILSTFLFCLAINWTMKRTDIGFRSGIMDIHRITWADDIALLAHSHRDIRTKLEKLVRNSATVGLQQIQNQKQCETAVKQQTQSNLENTT